MKIAMMTELPLRYMDQEHALRLIRSLGYDGVDITLLNAMDDQDEMRREDYQEHAKHLGRVCQEIGLTPVQAHAPFPIHKEGDAAYDAKMLAVTKQCLEICALIGVPVLVVHPWNNWNAQENKTRWFDLLYPTAERYRVIIATENMWNWDLVKDRAQKAACSSPEDFLELCALIDKPYFKACVDVGHANMFPFDPAITPSRMIETLGPRYVRALHLHDNDGWHDLHHVPETPGDTLDWTALLRALKAIDYRYDLVAETQLSRSAPLEEAIAQFKQQKDVLDQFRSILNS
jgi:sugar phosphate isomerase/epimerase